MPKSPPSKVRVVSHEPINKSEVRIMVEVIVDVHRLAEISGEFLATAAKQARLAKPKRT